MDQDIRANANHIPISAQKARLVVDLVRGKDVIEALEVLSFTPNKAAEPVSELINSAIANAETNNVTGIILPSALLHSDVQTSSGSTPPPSRANREES